METWYKVEEILCRKIRKTNGKEIQIQNWGINRQLSMEGIAAEYFPNSVHPGSNIKNHNLIHI